MKRLLAVAALLSLSACGGGGSSSGSGAGYVDTATLSSGVLKVSVASQTESSPIKSFTLATPDSNFRVVLTNPGLRTNGRPFSYIQDMAPGASLTLPVPASGGYTLEIITYATDPATGLNKILSYGIATGVTVDASGASSADLSLYPVQAAVVTPASVVQGAPYNVFANLSSAAGRNATPLSSSWFLNTPKSTSFAPFVNRTSATVFAPSHSYTAPITGGVPTDLYFQGVFSVKPTLLNSGESAKRWVFNANEVAMPVTAPINLTIQLPDF